MNKELISGYEKKRNRALADAEWKKREMTEKYPELQSIEEQVQQIGLSYTKAMLHINEEDQNSYVQSLNMKLKQLKKSKQDIFERIGVPLNAFEPAFECMICKDTGFIEEKSQMCSCYKQRLINCAYKQANLDLIDIDNFQSFEEKLYSDEQDVGKYGTKTSPRENILRIKKKCLDFIEDFDKQDTKNLLLIGDPGIGKTFMSNCIAKELLEREKTVIYQTASRLLDMVMDYKMRYDRQEHFKYEEYNKLFEVNLLVLDDLGIEAQNPSRLSELFTIINTRLLTQKTKNTKTILSTNLPLEELNRYYDDRLMSRILGEFYICKFFGDDIRIKRGRAG